MQIVRRKNFVGVVAEREWDAVRAARQLKVTWEPFAAVLPGHEGIFDSFVGQDQRHRSSSTAGERGRRARASRASVSRRTRIAGPTSRTEPWRRTAPSRTSRATAP